MSSIHFALIRMVLVSTVMLATSPTSISQNRPGTAPDASHSPKGLPSGQRSTRKLKAALHNSATPQVVGLNFANPVLYGSGGDQAESVAVADVNGDGKSDLVVANFCASGSSTCSGSEGSVGVLLGIGDGTFQTAVVYDSGGASVTSVAVADVNGDGHPDVIVTNSCASTGSCTNSTVGVLLNKGNGTFQPAVTYSSGGIGASSVAVGSLRGNGVVDLVVANCSSISNSNCIFTTGVVSVLLGNGNGTFQSAVTYSSGGETAFSVAVADLRSDGKLDVVATTGAVPLSGVEFGQVAVLLGNGDGTLQTPVIYGSGGFEQGLEGLAVADVNGDAKPDLIVATQCEDEHCSREGPSQVGVLLGNGDGTFQTAVTYDSGTLSANSVAVADLNGDGNQDLVVADSDDGGICASQGSIWVMLGNGDGSFQAPVGFCTGGVSPFSVAAADVNGDQKLDIIATDASASNCSSGPCEGFVAVLLNAVVQLSPTSVTFGNQALGTTSAPQIVTLTNTGTTLDISSIAITGPNANEFFQTNTCGTSVRAGQGCTISVTFTPTTIGNASAFLNVSDNVSGSPQIVPLSGSTLLVPVVNLSPSSISFPTQYVGTSGLPQTVTLTNTGTASLTITAVNTSAADFGVLSDCRNSVAAGASCLIGVFFDPTVAGNRSGALTITDNASGSPQSVPLAGMGQDFSMAPSGQTTATVTPGQSASYTISIASGGGFKQTVTLSCSGAPAQSTCSVSPSSIALGGTSATAATVTVITAASAALTPPIGGPSFVHPLGLWMVFSGMLGLALLLGIMPQRRKWRPQLFYGVTLLWLLSIGVTMTACSSGGNRGGGGGGTPAGTYGLTVTGTFTSGSVTLTHNTKLTLVVQ